MAYKIVNTQVGQSETKAILGIYFSLVFAFLSQRINGEILQATSRSGLPLGMVLVNHFTDILFVIFFN